MRQKIDDLYLVADWLAEFHHQAQISRTLWGDPERQQWLEKSLDSYKQAFGPTASEERLFAEVRKQAGRLIGTPLPTVWQHGGFHEQNIYRGDHSVTVVDWDGGDVGLPLFDLLYFVTHWSYAARHLHGDAAQLRGFRELFLEPARGGASVNAAHRAIARYMARLDLDRRFLPLLLVLMWVQRALGRFHRQGALGVRGPNARLANQYVGFIGALAEHVERLFARPIADSR